KLTVLDAVGEASACSWPWFTVTKPLRTVFFWRWHEARSDWGNASAAMKQEISRGPGFPTARPRRLRHHPLLRGLVRATTLTVQDFILPLFVRPGRGVKKEIPSMPGNYQLGVDRLVDEVGAAAELGVRAFILFGIPERKDASGSSAWDDDGIVQQALRS